MRYYGRIRKITAMHLPVITLISLVCLHGSQGAAPPAASDKGCSVAKISTGEFAAVAPSYDPNNLIREDCRTQCKKATYKYAALRNGNMCLCGNSFGAAGTATTCTSQCTGETAATCGGSDAFQVYSTPVCDIGMSVGFLPAGNLATYEKINLTAVMTSCAPSYIELEFTDGTPDGYSTAVSVDFYPQDTGNQNVKIVATDPEGNKQDSNANYQSFMRVQTELDCPDFWSENHMFECTAIFPMGNDISASLNFDNGRTLTFTPADAQIYKYGSLTGSNTAGTVKNYLMINDIVKKNASVVGVDYVTTKTSGTFKVQVFRPVCEGATPQYCARIQGCISATADCATQSQRGVKCGTTALYSIAHRTCVSKTSGQTVPQTIATAWSDMPAQKYVLLVEDTVTTTANGSHFAPLSISEKLMPGDIFGVNDAGGVVSTTSSTVNWQFTVTGATSTGSVITTGTAESSQLMLRVHVVAPSKFVVQHNYTTGLRIYNISLSGSNGLPSSNATHHLIDIQQNITDVDLTCRIAVKTNATATIQIPSHPGSKVTYYWDFGDGNTAVDLNKTILHVFKNAGVYFVNVTAANNISSDTANCTIIVQDEIKNLQLTPGQIATYLTKRTHMTWNISQGTNTTYAVDLGNGNTHTVSHTAKTASASHYDLEHQGLQGNLTYKYPAKGNFTLCVNASNLVSTIQVCKVVPVQEGILNVNIDSVSVLKWGIVNPVPVSMSQGSDYWCHANFGTDRLADNLLSLPESSHSGNVQIPLTYAVGYYDLFLHCENLVSKGNITKKLLIEYEITNCTMVASTYFAPIPIPVLINLTMLRGSHYSLTVNSDNSEGTKTSYVEKTEAGNVVTVQFTYSNVKVSQVFLDAKNNISQCNRTATIVAQHPVKDLTFDMPSSIVLNKGATARVNLTLNQPSNRPTPTDATYIYTYGDGTTATDTYSVSSGSKLELTKSYTTISTLNITVKISNLVSSMYFNRELRVDQPIEDPVLTVNPTAIEDNTATKLKLVMSWGSRVTVEWDFGDGTATQTTNHAAYTDVMEVSHVYANEGFYYAKVNVTNSIGSKIATSKVILVQRKVQALSITCPPKTHLLKANNWRAAFALIIKLATGTPTPTNMTTFVDFGDEVNSTTSFMTLSGSPLQATISHPNDYRKGNQYYLTANVSNLVSFLELKCTIDIIEEIEAMTVDVTHKYYSAPRGPTTIGGVKYMPSDYPVFFKFVMTHGSHIYANFTWGDGQSESVYLVNTTEFSHNFTENTFTTSVTAWNDISQTSPITPNPETIKYIRPCWGVSLFVDNPRPENTSFNFQVDTGRVGTKCCYLVDLEDDKALVGKRYRLFGDKLECDRSYKPYSTGQYASQTDFQTLDETKLRGLLTSNPDKRANFTFLTVYKTVRLYKLAFKSANYISNETYVFEMRVTNGWCYPPKLKLDQDNKCESFCDDNGHQKVYKSKDFSQLARPSFNCTQPGTYYVWSIYSINEKTNAETRLTFNRAGAPQMEGNTTSLIKFPKRFLNYGLYKITLNISMTGEPGISSASSTYVRIVKTDLQSSFSLGNVKYNQNITMSVLDYVSDPDVEPDNKQGMTCEWICKLSCESSPVYDLTEMGVTKLVSKNTKICNISLSPAELAAKAKGLQVPDYLGCLAFDNNGAGLINISRCDNVTIDTYNFHRNTTMDFTVIVRKDNRLKLLEFSRRVVEGDPPEGSTQCVSNCDKNNILVPTDPLAISTAIKGAKRGMIFIFAWTMWKVHDNGSMTELEDSRWVNLTTTGKSLDNIVFRAKAFLNDASYDMVILLICKMWQAPIIDYNNYGTTAYKFKVNRPPANGTCAVVPAAGVAASTKFKFHLSDEFKDDNLPLSYALSYKCGNQKVATPLFSGKSVSRDEGVAIIPQGQGNENVTCAVMIRATDSVGTYTDISCNVVVAPPPMDKLAEMAKPSPEAFKEMQASGDPTQVVQYAMAFAQMTSLSSSGSTSTSGSTGSGTSTGTGGSTGGTSGSSGGTSGSSGGTSGSSGGTSGTSGGTSGSSGGTSGSSGGTSGSSGGTGGTSGGTSGSSSASTSGGSTELTEEEKKRQEEEKKEQQQLVSSFTEVFAAIPVKELPLSVSRNVLNAATAVTANAEIILPDATENCLGLLSSVAGALADTPATVSETLDSADAMMPLMSNALKSMNYQMADAKAQSQDNTISKTQESTETGGAKVTEEKVEAHVAQLESVTASVTNTISAQLVAGDNTWVVGTNDTYVIAVAKVFSRKMKEGHSVEQMQLPSVDSMLGNSDGEGNSTDTPYSIECKMSASSVNTHPNDISTMITNTQVMNFDIVDELGIRMDVTKSDDWLEIMLLHTNGKMNETFVNVTEDQKVQPIHQFQVLNASALFVGVRDIPIPKAENAATAAPTTQTNTPTPSKAQTNSAEATTLTPSPDQNTLQTNAPESNARMTTSQSNTPPPAQTTSPKIDQTTSPKIDQTNAPNIAQNTEAAQTNAEAETIHTNTQPDDPNTDAATTSSPDDQTTAAEEATTAGGSSRRKKRSVGSGDNSTTTVVLVTTAAATAQNIVTTAAAQNNVAITSNTPAPAPVQPAPTPANQTAPNNTTNANQGEAKTPWCLKDPELMFTIYINEGTESPTPEKHLLKCTLPLKDAEIQAYIDRYNKNKKWKIKDFDRCTCFFRQNQMNLTEPRPFSMSVVPMNITSNETITDGLQYAVKVWTPSCQYFDKNESSYKTDGVEVGPMSTENATQCLTEHLTSFGGGFVVPMNSINLKESAFTKLNENPVVFAVMVSLMCLYLVMLIYVRKKDKTDEVHAGATPLLDNNPMDKYLYELVFFTGSRKNAGTSAKVHCIISGENGDTEPRLIFDDKRAVLKRSGVDVFLMSVPQPLGPLTHLRIWHDNTGEYPSWYFERLQVTDLQTEDVYFYVCDRWLAVEEDDGMIDRVMPVAGMEELTHFNHLFWIKAKRDLTDGHIWFSVFQRPKRSRFTRVQRLTCCLTLLFSSMMASILFYKSDENIQGKQVLRLGPLEITPQQIYVGFISSMIALPANIIIALIFRYAGDIPKCKKEKEQPPVQHGSNVLVVDNHEHRKIAKPEDDDRKMHDELQRQSDYLDTGDIDQRLLVTPNHRPATASTSSSQGESYEGQGQDITALALPMPPPKKKKFQLHWGFKIFAYVFSFCIVAVTFWVTVEVAGVFGKKKSLQWLLAFVVSVVESIFLSQPIKVLVLAAFYALVIRKPDTDSDEAGTTDLRKNEEWLHKHFTEEDMNNPETMKLVASYKSALPEPPDEEYLQEARQMRFKEIKMNKIIWEIIFYFLFLWLLMMVAYGNRDPQTYNLYKHYQKLLVKASYDKVNPRGTWDLQEVRSRAEFWDYVSQVLLPGLYDNKWYDGTYHSQLQGFMADGTGYLVGQPRLRQVRTVPEECHRKVKHLEKNCEKGYSIFTQDEGEYSFGWKKVNYSDPANNKPETSWIYRSWLDLSGYPYWGKYNSYSGGGYTADLGTTLTEAQQKYEELRSNRWVDSNTRAIFIEFLVYNPSVNLFGISMVAMEAQESGAMYLYFKFHVMRLDRYVGPFMFVVMAGEILTLVFIIYFLVKEIKKLRKFGKAYFKDSWNIFETLILSLAIVTIVMYFFRLVHSARQSKKLREEPNRFHNLQYAALWDESFTYLMAFMCSLSTLKFLKLLRFNRRMAMLSSTLRYAAGPIIQFLIMFLILFLAFVLASYIVFGMDLEDFSTFARSMATLFSAMLNKFNFYNLKEADRIFGPTILFLFTLMITFILINVFITLICEAFSIVKDDLSQQSNEYEIVDFVVDRFKMVTGLGEPKTKMPRRRRKVKEYNYDDYVEATDEDIQKEQERIDKMMAKLEFLIFHKDHKPGKPVSDPKGKFEDWRERKKKGILYR